MEQLTLQQLFGVNVIENNESVIINKADLFSLTPSANNRAESILVAIINNALRVFAGTIDDENNEPLQDENGEPISFNSVDSYEALSVFLWKQYPIVRNDLLVIKTEIILHSYTPYED